jgi:peptidoglycan/LPS O-acetylase OafA/YrhL
MYLWNSIIFDHLHGGLRIAGIPLTLAVAAVSMRLVEARFLARKRRAATRVAPERAAGPELAPSVG